MAQKRALILGVGGQDGSYLAELLLERGYQVHGMHRRSSTGNLRNVQHLVDRITLHRGDLLDAVSLRRTLEAANPDEVYNEADQDDINWSWSFPSYQLAVTAGAVGDLLELLRGTDVRLFQPVSAMMFGMQPPPQSETTPLDPRSPYAAAKAAAWYLCRAYREKGVKVSCGIMFNHDSPNRSEDYLLHKVCAAAVRIAAGKQNSLAVGNLEQRLDVGFARDYMEAAILTLQHEPGDYCIGSGRAVTVSDIVYAALNCAEARCMKVDTDERFYRPFALLPNLCANIGKISSLGWKPKTSFADLIRLIVDAERAKL